MIKRGRLEPIEDIFKFIQDKLDGYNDFMDGKDLTCNPMINVGEKEIDTGKFFRGASR